MSIEVETKPPVVWVVSENNAGTINQAIGVAGKLTPDPVIKRIAKEKRLRRWFAPFRQDTTESEPALIISCGRVSEYFVRIMKHAYGNRPFAVHLQPPGQENDCYDLAFISSHDWRPEFEANPRRKEMLGVPHRVSSENLIARRAAARSRWSGDDRKTLTVLIGGPNKAYTVDGPTVERLRETVTSLLQDGWRILATISRRSPPIVAAALGEIKADDFTLWNYQGENPYPDFMAAADAFLVTKDSISMTCEAAATGKPVYSLDLATTDPDAARKFERFHRDMQQRGFTRAFDGRIEPYEYSPLDETMRISSIIKRIVLEYQGQKNPSSACN